MVRGLILVGLMLLSVVPSSAETKMQCGPGEYMDDLSGKIPPGSAAVWLLPAGGAAVIYEYGHPEDKGRFGNGAPMVPRRFLLHGPGLFCTVGERLQGIFIWKIEPGA
jgi:hypothetical protein